MVGPATPGRTVARSRRHRSRQSCAAASVRVSQRCHRCVGDSARTVGVVRQGYVVHHAGRRPSASRARRERMAIGPGGRWMSRMAKAPKSPMASAPTMPQTTMCASIGTSLARRRSRQQPHGGNQEGKDQHRHVSSCCPDAADGVCRHRERALTQEPGKIVYLDRTVVVDAVNPSGRVELLELCRCQAGWTAGFAGCDVRPEQRQPLGETSVGHDVANVVLADEGDVRRGELRVEEQRGRVVRPVERSDRVDLPEVVEQPGIVAVHRDVGTCWEVGTDPIRQRE